MVVSSSLKKIFKASERSKGPKIGLKEAPDTTWPSMELTIGGVHVLEVLQNRQLAREMHELPLPKRYLKGSEEPKQGFPVSEVRRRLSGEGERGGDREQLKGQEGPRPEFTFLSH